MSKEKFEPNPLPDKMSALIRLALADLEKAEKDPYHLIRMHSWHEYEAGYCHVCLAGAVMAGTLKVPASLTVTPKHFDTDTSRKLLAIDAMRDGNVDEAASWIYNDGALEERGRGMDRDIAAYRANPLQFKRDMARLADDLEAIGE
jgi:hypothetical protein